MGIDMRQRALSESSEPRFLISIHIPNNIKKKVSIILESILKLVQLTYSEISKCCTKEMNLEEMAYQANSKTTHLLKTGVNVSQKIAQHKNV